MLKKITLILLLVCMVGTSVIPQKKNRVYGYEPVLKNTDKEIDDKQEIEKINYLSTTDEFFDISKKDIGNEVIYERTIDSKTSRVFLRWIWKYSKNRRNFEKYYRHI